MPFKLHKVSKEEVSKRTMPEGFRGGRAKGTSKYLPLVRDFYQSGLEGAQIEIEADGSKVPSPLAMASSIKKAIETSQLPVKVITRGGEVFLIRKDPDEPAPKPRKKKLKAVTS